MRQGHPPWRVQRGRRHSGDMTDNPASSPTPPPPYPGAPGAGGEGSTPRGTGSGFFGWLRTLGLARGDAWVGGVCGGIAARLGIDPLIVRGIFVVAAVLGLPMLLVYAILWVVLPDRAGVIHLESLFHGRLEPPSIAALVIVVLSFVPVIPWVSNLLLWSGGSWGGIYDIGGALSVLWRGLLVLALIGLVIVAIVAISRRPRHRGRDGAQAGFDPYATGASAPDPRGFGAAPYGGQAPYAGTEPYGGPQYGTSVPTSGAWPVPRLDTSAPAPSAFSAGPNGAVSEPHPVSAVAASTSLAADGTSSGDAPSPSTVAGDSADRDTGGDSATAEEGAADSDDTVRAEAARATDEPAGSVHGPAAPAWHEGALPTHAAASGPAASGPAASGAMSAVGASTSAPSAAPLANAPYDTWRQQQDQWRAEHDTWRQQQRDAERIARELARAEAAEATARANREYEEARARRRASRPRTALWYVALTLGVMAVGGAAVALTAAPRGTMMAATLAFLAATAVGAVAMIIAGIARRRSGFITFLTISSLVIAAGTLVPALSVGRPWSGSEVARVDGQVLLPLGSASISGPDPADRTYLQSFGFTNLYLNPWMAADPGFTMVEPDPVPTATAVPAPSSSPEPSTSTASPSLIPPMPAGSITLEKGGEGSTQIDVEAGMIVTFTITASSLSLGTYHVEDTGDTYTDTGAIDLPAPQSNGDGTYTWRFTLDTMAESPLIAGEPTSHARSSVTTDVTITQQDDVWINAGLAPERKR